MEWSLPVYGCIKYSQFPVKKSSVKILNKTSYYCMQCWQKQILPPASHPSGFIYVLYFQFYVKILLPPIYILFFAGNSWISQSKRLIFPTLISQWSKFRKKCNSEKSYCLPQRLISMCFEKIFLHSAGPFRSPAWLKDFFKKYWF